MSSARDALAGRQTGCGELVSTTEEAPPEEDGRAIAVLIAVLAVIAIAFGGG